MDKTKKTVVQRFYQFMIDNLKNKNIETDVQFFDNCYYTFIEMEEFELKQAFIYGMWAKDKWDRTGIEQTFEQWYEKQYPDE